MPETAPRRLSLLYQLYLTSQASRNLMRQSMRATDMGGEEYALYSYLFANGPRTLTQGARDLGLPITSLATLLAPAIDRGDVDRLPHPRDGRARLLRLTAGGRDRLERAIPAFSAGYRAVLAELADEGANVEELFATLDVLRGAINGAIARLESERDALPG